MTTQCDIQAAFSFRHDRTICVGFKSGKITSDAGLVALREFDHRIGSIESIVDCLHDDRHRSYVIHNLLQLIIQRPAQGLVHQVLQQYQATGEQAKLYTEVFH